MMFRSHSQNGEDIVLWRALGSISQGTWIDVGANDPVVDSVTKVFSDAGWSGVNIDPLPVIGERLREVRPRDRNLCLALGSAPGDLRFFTVEGALGLSTTDSEAAASYVSHGLDVTEHSVPMRTLASVWDEYVEGEVHFLKIDVEGAERAVLEGADFSRHRPWIVLVESVEPVVLDGTQPKEPGAIRPPPSTHDQWESLLTTNGYQFVLFDGLNRFYVARERAELLAPLLSVPFNVLDQAELSSSRAERDRLEQELACLLAERDALGGELAAIRASFSWRVTSPLRRLRSFFS